jgi:hypothetical protein
MAMHPLTKAMASCRHGRVNSSISWRLVIEFACSRFMPCEMANRIQESRSVQARCLPLTPWSTKTFPTRVSRLMEGRSRALHWRLAIVPGKRSFIRRPRRICWPL